MPNPVSLDGRSLTPEAVVAVARRFAPVTLHDGARERLSASRAVVEAAAAGDAPVYGINTGFGKLQSVRIPGNQLRLLQRNLIVSHASGLGEPLPVEIVRALMTLRINVLLMPTSGVRPLVPDTLTALLNAGIHPVVPEQGSVGASGDLAPLSHVALALIGEGEVDVVPAPGAAPVRRSAADAMREAGVAPVVFEAKEGLAFINGTQAQTAVLALVVHDAQRLWTAAHASGALSLEALKGSPDPFDERLHAARPHPGQVASAALLRRLLENSPLRESHRTGDERVQDPYCLRCIPQVYGAVKDTLDHAAQVVAVELNGATDNPLVFGEDLVSGGNFHGQPVAMALDFLAVALTTIAGLAERRLERILNPDLSPGLPPFLAANPGLESGLMMVQIMAASLVGECRTLCTPASVQSIPTDANQEDYVPMGMTAAMKAVRVLENAKRVIGAEFLCAAEGLEHHRPLRSSDPVEHIHRTVRAHVPPLSGDRSLRHDLERLAVLTVEESWI